MRPRDNDLDTFSTSPISAQPYPLRHFPRATSTTSHGLSHTTILIIAVSASVGGLVLVIICWRILSRLSERSRRAPFPQRQALVHQRERQLVAFTEHINASVPKFFADDTSNTASSLDHEADEGTEAAPSSSAVLLEPPTPPFCTPNFPTSASSTSIPSSHGRSSPSSDGTHPRIVTSPSMSPSLRVKRSADPGSSQRPHSMVSIGTTRTTATMRSRTSMRCAPHAPHSNVQVVLPAPLAPSLYARPRSAEPRLSRSRVVDSTYSDSWRSSMVDTWVPVGQHGTPEPEPMERQRSRDSMERRSRLTRRTPSPADVRPRSRSNPSPLSRTSGPSFEGSSQDTHPPVPRVPSMYGVPSGQHGPAPPSNTQEHRASWNPPSSFNGSRKLRS